MQSISRSSIWFTLAFWPSLLYEKIPAYGILAVFRAPAMLAGGKKDIPDDRISLCDLFWLVLMAPLRALGFAFLTMVIVLLVLMATVLVISFAALLIWWLGTIIVHAPSNIHSWFVTRDWWQTLVGTLVIVGLFATIIGLVIFIPLVKTRIKAFKEKTCPILEIVS